MNKISLDGLKKVLKPHQMRNVLGGSGGTVTGVRCWNGQCYCDIHLSDGDIVKCDVKCDMVICEDFGISC